MACAAANIEPLIATGRQPHHPSLRERFAAPPPAPENPTPVEAMAWRLRTPQGKQLYGLRKQTPEPVFGIIKSVMGFRCRRRGMGNGLLLRRKAKPALALLRRLNPHVEIGAGEAMQFPTVGTRRFWLAPGIV